VPASEEKHLGFGSTLVRAWITWIIAKDGGRRGRGSDGRAAQSSGDESSPSDETDQQRTGSGVASRDGWWVVRVAAPAFARRFTTTVSTAVVMRHSRRMVPARLIQRGFSPNR
jgi:hypothetical protein